MTNTQNVVGLSRYDSLDGLRTFSAVAIVAMHIYANFGVKFDNFVFSKIISSFGMLTLLFMMLSGFSMCCGYYDKIINGKISITKFYEKRYTKILPFFALLTLIDVLANRSINSVFEGFANLTLGFGLLPNANIQVIGMGWTLGTIFTFYMLFPFFCFLLKNKKMAWFSLIITGVYNYLCLNYFFNENHMLEGFWSAQNIVYCSMFFIAGGLIYLYRNEITKVLSKFHWAVLIIALVLSIIYYVSDGLLANNYFYLIVFSIWLIYGLHSKNIVLNNPVTKFISGVSMEIYLAHMFAFRIIEKVNLKYLFGKSILSYVITLCMTLLATIIFAVVVKWLFGKIGKIYKRECAA